MGMGFITCFNGRGVVTSEEAGFLLSSSYKRGFQLQEGFDCVRNNRSWLPFDGVTSAARVARDAFRAWFGSTEGESGGATREGMVLRSTGALEGPGCLGLGRLPGQWPEA